jgi:hypothetical protein
MKYDLIIISRSSDDRLKKVTQNCINSARKDNSDLNIIIVETFQLWDYENVNEIILYEGEFNYNKALNLGLKSAKGDIYILANNDIQFYEGWSQIGSEMLNNGFDSASALSNDERQKGLKRGRWIYEGYLIGVHLTGWCIFLTKECYKAIGKLNETFDFWYSDNVYADQLQAKGLKHGLFCNIRVDHLTSATLRTMPKDKQREYSYGSQRKYLIHKRKEEKKK